MDALRPNRKTIIPVLLFSTLLFAQNYLPEERKGDWQSAGCLRFIRESVVITQTNNILEYGGDNTGLTGSNNHTAIANAIADRSTEGTTLIYFPAGTYVIESVVVIYGTENVILCGEGSESTELTFSLGPTDLTCFYLDSSNTNRVGFENFYIERLDSSSFGRYFTIFTDSCWISGVECNHAATEHVYISSSNVEIRGCYFHHCWTYGKGGQGYGVVLQTGASGCLIEDNIFNHFRHAVILSNGPHDNVIGYNYSRDPYTTETYLGISDWPSDMCLHGHPIADSSGPYMNLFEGNICTFMEADSAWDENGPYNTYFRSRATYYGLKICEPSDNQNVIANELDDSEGSVWDIADFLWSAFDIQSDGNYVVGNINFDPSPPVYPEEGEYSADLSLYLDPENLPDFLDTIEYFPPIGAVDALHLGGGSIPAKDRWDAGGVLTVMETHPYTGSIVISDLALQEDATETLHDDLRTVFGDDFTGGELTFSIQSNSNPSLVSVTINSDSTLMVTPAPDANGTATIVVRADNTVEDSVTDEFVITVHPVNDPPSFTKGDDRSVNEDCEAVTVENWATSINAGPSNEPDGDLNFSLTTDNDDLFAQLPTIDETGTLSFTPANDANGEATVSVVLSDGGGGDEMSDPQTFTITVNAVNDPPSFTKGDDRSVNEDCEAVTVENWATAISAGPSNEPDGDLSFSVTTDNDDLFAQLPTIDETGTLSFTPANDANGEATVSVVLSDGGEENGSSGPQTFTITVNPVNDPPSFTKGDDRSVDEDCGPVSVENWATAINAGPSNEPDGDLSFSVTTDNDDLFAQLPTIDETGTLSFTPANDANGEATVSVVLSDGGEENGSSGPQTFTITVNPVNDPPSFTKGDDRSVNEDCEAVTVENWATAISAGPSNEPDGDLNFSLTTDNDDLFFQLPAIDETGTLSFTPADNANGMATVSVILSDGGEENGSSGPQTFTITVNPVNDPPSFTKGDDQNIDEDCGLVTVESWATAIRAGPSNESGQKLHFTVTIDNDVLFAKPPSIDASGTLSFTPEENGNGKASVSVILSDDGGTANGGTAAGNAQTFTITVRAKNDAPEITSSAVTEAKEGKIYSYTVTTIDIDGDDLTFSLADKPDGMAVNAETGTVTWTPEADDAGFRDVTIKVEDNDGASDEQHFTITVEPKVGVKHTVTSREKITPILPLQLRIAPNPVHYMDNRVIFGITGRGRVSAELVVYDAVANMVFKKIFTADLAGDVTTFGEWNLRNRSGRRVTPGTYLAVVTFSDTSGRILLVAKNKIGITAGCR